MKDDSEHSRGGVAGAHRSPFEIQRRALELIATGQSLDIVFHALVTSMEAQHASMRASILLIYRYVCARCSTLSESRIDQGCPASVGS